MAAGQLSYGGNEPEKWKRACNVIKLINSIYFSCAKCGRQGPVSPCLAETDPRWAGERSPGRGFLKAQWVKALAHCDELSSVSQVEEENGIQVVRACACACLRAHVHAHVHALNV